MPDSLEPGASPVPANEPAAVIPPTPESITLEPAPTGISQSTPPPTPEPGFHNAETKPYTADELKATTTQPAESATPLSTGPVFGPARYGNDLGPLMPTTPIETPANPEPQTPVQPPTQKSLLRRIFRR